MKKLIVFLLFSLTLTACNLADQRVVKLRALTEKVERRGERFTTQEWKDVLAEYAQLEADFKDLPLSEAQADTVYYLKKRFKKACVHSAIESKDNALDDVATNMKNKVSNIILDSEEENLE